MKSVFKKQVGGTHYRGFKIPPVEFIQANQLGFLEGCVIKRLCRYKNKGGIEDLKKIQHEIELLIALEYPSVLENITITDLPPKLTYLDISQEG